MSGRHRLVNAVQAASVSLPTGVPVGSREVRHLYALRAASRAGASRPAALPGLQVP